jgi:hypothetical protein
MHAPLNTDGVPTTNPVTPRSTLPPDVFDRLNRMTLGELPSGAIAFSWKFRFQAYKEEGTEHLKYVARLRHSSSDAPPFFFPSGTSWKKEGHEMHHTIQTCKCTACRIWRGELGPPLLIQHSWRLIGSDLLAQVLWKCDRCGSTTVTSGQLPEAKGCTEGRP